MNNFTGNARVSWVRLVVIGTSVAALVSCSSSDAPGESTVDDIGFDAVDGSGGLGDIGGDAPDDGATDALNDVPADLGRDIVDTGGDASDDIDASDADAVEVRRNLCGGFTTLTFQGELEVPGGACGTFGEGRLVCNGSDALRCAGVADTNACGGTGLLRAEPGEPCGCGGVVACDRTGGVFCEGLGDSNLCGGCAPLLERPGAVCDVDGTAGLVACTGLDSTACVVDAANACGGAVVLTVDGEVIAGAGPGQACVAASCGAGVYACDGDAALTCVPFLTCNACGGGESLAGTPNDPCGGCDEGLWACLGNDEVACEILTGAPLPNDCGGCGELDGAPATACTAGGGDGVYVCAGTQLECLAESEADAGTARNACGGTAALDGTPAEPCGSCGAGEWVCTDRESVACSVPESDQANACGGCTRLGGTPGRACGTCSTGEFVCAGDNESVVCQGDEGSSARNACGGCGELGGSAGDGCGECQALACQGLRLVCLPTPGVPGCIPVTVCAELACEDASRRCLESDGVVDAECGACLDGYIDDAGACREVATCASLACEDAGRDCDEETLSADAVCTSCLSGYTEQGGVCVTNAACSELGCAAEGRECVETGGVAECGGCIAGRVDDAGVCRLRFRCVDLDCPSANRSCVAGTDGSDDVCGDCLTGHIDQGDTCARVDCGPLAAPADGSLVAEDTTYESVAIIACDAGFTIDGSAERTCQADGNWSGTPAACLPVDCGALAAPENGGVDAASTTLGGVAAYRCNTGYELTGNVERTCEASGNWSGSPATCDPVDCGGLDDPTNGTVTVGATTLASTATYQCDAGYSLFGSASAACLPSGAWSNPAPSCELSDCGSLSAPANGTVTVPGTSTGDVATFACNAGYEAVGPLASTCEAGGSWSTTGPTCSPLDCGTAPAASANSTLTSTSSTTFGGTASYGCSTGYTLNGTTSGAATYARTCTSDGTWDAASGTCQPVACPVLTAPANGSVGAGAQTFGTTRTYSCNTGYTLTGATTRSCQASGAWTGSAPTCAVVNCGSLTPPANGSVNTSGGTTYNQVATYACSTNFELVGGPQRTCQSSGNWGGAAPTCAPVLCPVLSAPSDGAVTISARTVGGSASFRCNDGWSISGSATLTCQTGGVWSGPAPTCAPVDCGAPFSPENGGIDYDSTLFNSAAQPTCDTGFSLSGPSEVYCQSDGRWTTFDGEDTWSCEPVVCGDLEAPTDGFVTTPNGTEYNDVATYTCRAGYELSGPSTRTCQSNGSWSGAAPDCVQRSCGDLPAPGPNSTSIMGTPSFVCDEGYTIGGTPTGATQYTYTCDSVGSAPFFTPVWRKFPLGNCTEVLCPTLSAPQNGTVSAAQTPPGGSVTYACNSGYGLNGNATRTCQEDATWTGSGATCSPLLPLGARCTTDSQCGDGAWCPTDTLDELRRCSPRVFAAAPQAMDFVFVPAGNFMQGTPGATDNERPYLAGLSRNYWVSRTEITQGQWTAMTGGVNPSCFQSTTGTTCTAVDQNGNGPVEQVDWYSVAAYANALSQAEGLDSCYTLIGCGSGDWWHDGLFNGCTDATFAGLDCNGYRLLTESEWERAARAGTDTTYYWGEDATGPVVGTYAWYGGNAGSRSHTVGEKLPNAFGLYDMIGNLEEFVWDLVFIPSAAGYVPYPEEPTVDWLGGTGGYWRGARGGSWFVSNIALQRVARRRAEGANGTRFSRLGFRLARTVPTGSPGTLGCGLLTAPSGGQVLVPNTFTGAVATYSCDPAATLTGSATRTCQADRNWSGSAPTCVFPGCGIPPAVADGSSTNTGLAAGDTATYSCDYGYEQEVRAGGATLTCQTNGTWFNTTAGSGTPPACDALTCPAPVAPIDGQVDYSSRDHGATALHSCDAGYGLIGDDLQTCDAELGDWFGPDPVCLRDCGTLPAPTDGSVELTGTLQGADADFTCDEGFILQGSARRTCQATGDWNGTETTCKPVDCGNPGKPAGGSRTETGTGFGDIVTWECDPEFTLQGSSSATCLGDGTWSAPTPICAAGAGQLCEDDEQCPDGFWCPQTDGGLPADHRRCSPVVDQRNAMTVRTFWIPSGTYTQGSPTGELGRATSEVQHETVLSRPIWVMEHPVPQSLYESVTRAAPFLFNRLAACDADPANPGRCPAERMNWFDAMAMANALSAAEGLEECYSIDETSCTGTPHTGCGTGINTCASSTWTCTKWDDAGPDCEGWRFPSEAEWEHTVRARTTRATWLGNLSGTSSNVIACPPSNTPAQTSLDSIALWCRNSGASVSPLGARPGNPWGPRDMLGHVAELTRDAYAAYPTDTAIDPWPSSDTVARAARGGAWSGNASAARAAARNSVSLSTRSSSLGLRLVRTVPADPDNDCGTLSGPINGSITYSDGLNRSSIATVACSPGYAATGDVQRVCMHTGVWSGSDATCTLNLQSLGETCDIAAQCPSGTWCPDVAAPVRRVCSPQPAPGGFSMPYLYAPPGFYNMGSPFAEIGRDNSDNRENQITVTHSNGFFMSRTEVTQEQWMALMNNQNPTAGTTGGFPTAPVTNVSWWSAAEYANRLSTANSLTACYDFSSLSCTGSANAGTLNCGTGVLPVTPPSGGALACTGYRLPTEAEWEYVARAGTTTATWAGNLTTTGCSGSDTLLGPLAYYCGNSLNPTFGTRHARPVGSKAMNPWGFFDTLGNINEHVWDTYATNLPGGTDPVTVASGVRSARGGSYNSNAEAVRAASRLSVAPSSAIGTLGFRLARSAP